MTGPLGNSEFCFPRISMFPETKSRKTLRFEGNKIHECFTGKYECFTGKYTTRKIHTKLHPGLEWRIFHILTSEDIDDFSDIKFVS